MFMKNMSCHHLFISFSSKCPKILFSIQIFIEMCFPRNRQEIPEDLRGRSSNHRQKGGLPRDGARRHAPHGLGGLSRCAAMSIQMGEIPMIHGFWNKIESQSPIMSYTIFDWSHTLLTLFCFWVQNGVSGLLWGLVGGRVHIRNHAWLTPNPPSPPETCDASICQLLPQLQPTKTTTTTATAQCSVAQLNRCWHRGVSLQPRDRHLLLLGAEPTSPGGTPCDWSHHRGQHARHPAAHCHGHSALQHPRHQEPGLCLRLVERRGLYSLVKKEGMG